MMMFNLFAPLGLFGAAADEDIRTLKTALNRLGYYTPPGKDGISETRESTLFQALEDFQHDHGLTPDAHLMPFDASVRAVDQALKNQQPWERYVWRTAGDDKVRGEHAARAGHVFRWADPPEGGHPGEDFNCRCWAERVEENSKNLYPDAINPTISPLDFIGGGLIIKQIIKRNLLSSSLKNTKWLRNVTRSKLQKKFKHAKAFGIRGNFNNKTLEQFRKALEKHLKSNKTLIIKGKYHGKPAIHHYNPQTRINVMRNNKGEFWSAWKLSKKQHFHMMKNGRIGGGR